MARIKYSVVVASISGSIGAACFQHGLYGDVLRSRPYSSGNLSSKSSQMRGVMSRVQGAWRSLSNDTRRQWEQYIAFVQSPIRRDKSILTTGYAFFCRYNFARLVNGLDILSAIVYKNNPDWPPVLSFERVDAVLQMNLQIEVLPAVYKPMIFLSAPKNNTISYRKSDTRLMLPATFDNYYYDLTAAYTAAFGVVPAVGTKVSYAVYWFSLAAPLLSRVESGTTTII